MIEWYNNLVDYSKVLFIIAVAFTVLLIIQLILLLVGLSGDGDFDASPSVDITDEINDSSIAEAGGLKLLSVRGITIFFCMYGWFGLLLMETTQKWWLATLVGVVCGVVVMILFAYVIQKMSHFEQEGNIELKNAIGKIGVVYLKIPAHKAGRGKVNLVIQESYVEVEAISNDEEDIPVGADVEIIDVINNYLLVKKLGGK